MKKLVAMAMAALAAALAEADLALGFEEYAQGTLLTEGNCSALTLPNEYATLSVFDNGGDVACAGGFTPPFTSAGTNSLHVKTTLGNPCAFSFREDKTDVEISAGHPYCVDFLARFTAFEGDIYYPSRLTSKAPLSKGLQFIDIAYCGFCCSIDNGILLWQREELDYNDEPVATNWCVTAGDGSGGVTNYVLTALGDEPIPDGDATLCDGGSSGWHHITFKACRAADSDSLFFNLFIGGRQVRAGDTTDFPSMAAGTSVSSLRFDGQGYVDNIVACEEPPPEIRNVTAKQRWPWNGLVDITCEVTGIDESNNDLYFVLEAVNQETASTNRLSHFWVVKDGKNSSDRNVHANGNYRLLWDAHADLGEVVYSNMVLSITIKTHDKVQLWEGGPYWATTNIGAEKPEGYGYYFWWGDTVGYKRVGGAWVASDGSSSNFSFGDDNAPTYTKDVATLRSQGWITAAGVLASTHDAAHVQWGGEWRMPTKDELSALINNCDWTWTTTNGVNGYIVRGKGDYASASICLPAAGFGLGSLFLNAGERGFCWSSVPSSGSGRSWRLYFGSDGHYADYGDGRDDGFAVRPVQGFTEAQVTSIAPAGDSRPFLLDARTGVRESKGVETLTYSSFWNGDANATVTIAQDGVAIAEGLAGEDTYSWSVQKVGTYVLTHTTYTNGVAGKVESVTFNVSAKDIGLAQVNVDCSDVTYRGTAYEPVVQSVKWGDDTLVAGTDFTLAYSDNVNAGTATITLTGINFYNGTYTTNFTIRLRALTQGMVGAIGNHPYAGKAQTPKPMVTDAELGVTLREDVEYTLSYANNTAIGDGIVTVTGKGNYTGSIVRTFVIEPSSGSELEESLGGAGKVETDGEGGWVVTITNDIDVANLPIEIPDDFGNVTIDLNGHDLVGGDGDPVIRIVPGHGDGEPTRLMMVTSGGDAIVQGGDGAPAVEVAEGAQEGVAFTFGEGVTARSGVKPEIRNVTARQRWPWNGKVDITYEIVGDIAAGLPEDAYAQLVVTATNRADGAIYVAAQSALSGDTGTAEGLHHVIWDLNAQGHEIVSDDVVFTVVYEENPCLYCVVDLSAGANAASYQVSYLADVPSGGWSNEYKTNKLVLRRIEAGSFQMGHADSSYNPIHNVVLTKSYFIGVFEVTQKQYELVTGQTPSFYVGPMRPVETVAWGTIRGNSNTYKWPNTTEVDSNSFMGRIQARTKIRFDLPTAAQWEYACRAGTTSAYNNGGDTESDLNQLGRYDGNRYDGKSIYSEHATVGSYLPNSWGLYDMHGNVREWCLDFSSVLADGETDPVGPSSGSHRVYRGGSWGSYADYCTSFYHNAEAWYESSEWVGFRLSLTLPGKGYNSCIHSSDGAAVAIDSCICPRASHGSETLTYSSLWDGDANATVTIAQDGVALAEGLTGEGGQSWSVQTAGTYTLTHTTYTNGIAGKVESATFNVAAKDISLAQVVVDCRDVTYSGAAVTPPIQSVIFWEKTLVEGTDFLLAYSGNVDVGMATITLTGANLYDGTYTTNFTIRPKMLTEGMVEAIGNHPYTGKAQTPNPTVTDVERGATLCEGVEYTLSYANNTAIGEGIVTVTGKGNYTGSIARAFAIEPSAGSELEEMLGGAGKAESDDAGGWIVTITNDVNAVDLPIEIPDDFGNVTIDLNGHDLIGGEGHPAIIIGSGHDEGGPTQLTIVTSGGDAIMQGGEGAPAVEVVEGAQDGVIINIGEGVTVQGGGVPAIDGTIGENNGNLVKVEVPVPVIVSKVYSGELLTADISPTDLYAVTNDGGVNVGNYPVALTLTDTVNYRWKDGDSEPIELTFTIAKRAVAVAVVGHTATYVYDSTEKSVKGYDATTEDSLYDIAADTAFRSGIIDAALPSVARTDVGVTMMGLTAADFANNNENFDVTYAVTDGWIKITSTKELDELTESFGGLPVSITPDEEGGWIVTITNDIDSADLPIEIPDNIGNVTIDLNGHDLVGRDGHDGACPSQAIVIVKGEGEGEPTVIAIVNSGEDATVVGGEGAPAIEVAEDAQGGVLINIGEGVSVQGGDDYTPAIIGEVGTNEGTIVKPSRIHIPGEGAVTTPKSWNVGQKVTWKAKAAKGSVFAHWEGEFVDSLGLSRNELRNPSLAFTVPKGFDASQITAVFIALDDDGLSELSFVDGEGEPIGDEDGILFELKADVGEFWLVDNSESYVTATVSGLPSGLKFDKKTLRITGAPTKSGVYWVQIKAKNASGYQWAEKVRMAVLGYTTEPNEPKLTRTAYHPLTVVSSDAAAGTVSGTGVYAEGKKASISAKPAKGRVFAGWYRDAALTKPMEFASGDYRKASQSVVVPEVRYLFARFVEATAAGDPITGLAAKGSGLVAESRFKWCVGVAVPEGDGVEYASASLPSASAAKLPAGVKFDAAKGCFTGVPTKAGTYVATVTVKNASKSTGVLGLTIEVAALPAWAVGTFSGGCRVESGELGLVGLARRASRGGFVETALPCGQVSLTIATSGKISGKILEGGKTWTLSAGQFNHVEHVEQVGGSDVFYATVIGKAGKEVVTNEVTVTSADGVGVATSQPFNLSTFQPFNFSWTAWQNLWKRADTKAAQPVFKKNIVTDLYLGEAGDANNRLQLTFKKDGVVAFSGMSGGTKVSGSSQVVMIGGFIETALPKWQVTFYAPPKGAFAGLCETIQVELELDEQNVVVGVATGE